GSTHVTSSITTRTLTTFDDLAVGPTVWSQLLMEGDTDVGSLTWQAQRQWWCDNERTDALGLILVERGGRPQAIASPFIECGMAMNLCPVTAADFVGDVSDPDVLPAVLQHVSRQVLDFAGFRFFFVPHSSRTGELLQRAAERLGFECFLEDEQAVPII